MISIIIVNYYSANQTKRAIESVLRDSEEKEIIVVDNTCTEGERAVLDEMQRLYGFSLMLNDENVGFARACNQAFSSCRGDYVFLLNPDAFVAPSCLAILRDFLENTPSAGSASPQVHWDDEMRYLFPHYSPYTPFQDFCIKLSSFSRAFRTFYSLYERSKNVALWKSMVPVKAKNLHGGAVMVRKSAAEQAGGLFDERFFLFFEDTDLFLRLRKKGFDLYIIPEAKAVHNYGHSGRKLEYLSQMSSLYYEKHFKGNLLSKITSHMRDGSAEGSYRNDGLWKTPPSFEVPPAFYEGFLFEWSSNSLFVPSIGCFGKGERFALSRQVWDLIGEGRYYSRFTSPARRVVKYSMGCWGKEA